MNKNSVGFTGTQKGINDYQQIQLNKILIYLIKKGYIYFENGDCIGADAEANKIAKILDIE